MHQRSARYYDAIYAADGKDYAREAQEVIELINQYARRPCRSLLDVACGTGRHLTFLRQIYEVVGLDLDPDMLAIARQRLGDVELHQADMRSFDLDRQFDAVVCLFSAIGYMKTDDDLRQAIHAMARHLAPGGVLLVEAWLDPDIFVDGHLSAVYVDEPELKLARISVGRKDQDQARLDFHYLVATPEGVEHFTEVHETGLRPTETYRRAFLAVGLEPEFEKGVLTGRGLHIGVRPEG